MFGMRLMIASGALWAAAGITVGILRTGAETAPPATAESPEPVLVEILAKADRLPVMADATAMLTKAFADRRLEPPVAVPAVRTDGPQTVAATVSAGRHHPTERNVCTRHGMRKVITRGGRSWRCRR